MTNRSFLSAIGTAALIATVITPAFADTTTQNGNVNQTTTQDGNVASINNSATLAGNVIRAASGNIGLNNASGVGNLQSNMLVLHGANGVSGPSLDVSDQASLYRDALHKAVDDAKLKAQSLADAAGLNLGGVQSITEGGASSSSPIADKMSAAGVPIEAGTQQIQASVTITYAAS